MCPHAALVGGPKLERCPSCGGAQLRDRGRIPPAHEFSGRVHGTDVVPESRLVACRACGLQFRDARLSPQAMDALYVEGDENTWAEDVDSRPDWRVALHWLEAEPDVSSVLDVGCFDGGFLGAIGPGRDLYGVEIHPGAAARASERGVHVVGADLRELGSSARRFDCITAFDIIEHVEDPLALLRTLAALVRPGGRIVIGTGNTEAAPWRLMGSRYWYVWNPEHISFVGVDWLRRAAPDVGLEVARVELISRAVAPSTRQRATELARNLVFRALPTRAWLALRAVKAGVRGRRPPDLPPIPPRWRSARDHMVVELLQASS